MKILEFNKLEELPVEEFSKIIQERFPLTTGYAYAIDKEFQNCELDDIVYIPEGSFDDIETGMTVYTKQDFINLCNNCETLAEYVYEGLEWQYPETYLEELCNNYTDIVIDYQADRIHDNSIHEALWNMLNEEEQQQVLQECHKQHSINEEV